MISDLTSIFWIKMLAGLGAQPKKTDPANSSSQPMLAGPKKLASWKLIKLPSTNEANANELKLTCVLGDCHGGGWTHHAKPRAVKSYRAAFRCESPTGTNSNALVLQDSEASQTLLLVALSHRCICSHYATFIRSCWLASSQRLLASVKVPTIVSFAGYG